MGSLMAGWDSAVKDPKTVTYQRNKSLTKDEIAAYWKSKNKTEGEDQENIQKKATQNIQRSRSLPLSDRREILLKNGTKIDADKLQKANTWWTRSNWAFLNEPPVIPTEGPSKYASQLNVAKLGNSEINAH